ncbi:hypothetical protein FB45DRAFT_1124318 [Roridomyces roridus]|uniref:Uncharacterized protein n=1 Tax=Roridomyces roridus TaxID=1738132 RepID=A0AAD7AXM7_9AGAR|nr:hypothetical protein FB45DRAFT_1045963 [Roridomyces roridus]KAJ7641006.1 hypothetical protein FB45DRAFT_1124318 [Roridomyces roridus]
MSSSASSSIRSRRGSQDFNAVRRQCLSGLFGVFTCANRSARDNFINNLNITGRIRAKARGKELAVAICNAVSDHKYVLRVHFKTEAHLFCMPTEMYRRIVSQPTRQRRSGLAFPVPPDCISGPKREDILLTIQAAFFWSALWSSTHGPVHSLEPTATRARFLAWRQSTIANDDDRPILFLMKDKQDIFNGCGAWESVDILVRALVHPAMPASLLCSNETVFHRFITAIMEHEHESTLAMGPGAAQPLPYTSNDSPFWFNREAHKKYVQRHVLCYRRASVSLPLPTVLQAAQMNLFVPNAVIGSDVPPGEVAQRATLNPIRDDLGTGTQAYSPFTAKPDPAWSSKDPMLVQTDVQDIIDSTTLGTYSFQIFVDCAWSAKRVNQSNKVLKGRRPTEKGGNRKRPRAEDIEATKAKAVQNKKRKLELDEQERRKENFAPCEGRVTRSRSKQTAV